MQKEIKNGEEEKVVKTPEREAALYKQQFEETEDRYKRVYAEFENYKKRTEKESNQTYENAKANIISRLLPILDSFEQAMSAKTEDQSYKAGIELIHKQFLNYLESMGVKEIKSTGEKFDPEVHDAVNLVEDSGLDSGIVVDTFRKGYMMDSQVIRHSMVIVQK